MILKLKGNLSFKGNMKKQNYAKEFQEMLGNPIEQVNKLMEQFKKIKEKREALNINKHSAKGV